MLQLARENKYLDHESHEREGNTFFVLYTYIKNE